MGNLDHIGPYELLGELGRGAMARVWRGWDPRLEREVAVKEPLFNPSYSPEVTAEMGRRFVSEAKAAARLTHPHIVAVYDADVWDGRAAIVMELVQGGTLAKMLERGPLPVDLALQVLDQLLDAVGFAHARGVIHRDIKPENVFLTPNGDVKLADFGVAHVDDGATRATVAGAVIGTPGYMSPEQATGRPVDRRSDLFSVGILAYEMLAGYGPFSSGNPEPTTLLYRVVHEPAPELPTFVLSVLPPYAAATIASALAKDPIDRPQSAEEFRAMLRGEMAVRRPGEYSQRTIMDTGSSTYTTSGQTGFTGGSSTTWPPKDTQPPKKGAPSWLPYAVVGVVLCVVLAFIFISATRGTGGGGGGGGVTGGTGSTPSPNSSSSSNTSVSASYYLAVQDNKVAVFQNGVAEPIKVSNLTTADLTSEDAAELGAGVQLSSIEDADKTIEEYRNRGLEAQQKKESEATLKAANTPPVFTEANASSELPPDQYTSYYGARNVLTEDTTTAWNEGAEGDGIGEWISVYSSEPQGVNGIYVINGYPKSDRVYTNNNRCKDVTIELSDGATFTTTLSDEMGALQKIDFGELHATTYVRITINSVYGGTKWTDTAICTIKPY